MLLSPPLVRRRAQPDKDSDSTGSSFLMVRPGVYRHARGPPTAASESESSDSDSVYFDASRHMGRKPKPKARPKSSKGTCKGNDKGEDKDERPTAASESESKARPKSSKSTCKGNGKGEDKDERKGTCKGQGHLQRRRQRRRHKGTCKGKGKDKGKGKGTCKGEGKDKGKVKLFDAVLCSTLKGQIAMLERKLAAASPIGARH